MSEEIKRRLIISGYDVDVYADGRHIIMKDGAIVSEQPSEAAMFNWVKEQRDKYWAERRKSI